MDRGVAIVLATAFGGGLALQAPFNSTLARSVGDLQASVIAFAVGLTALAAVTAVSGGFGGIANAGDAPWWAVVGGGLVSACYVASIIWTVRALGLGGLTAVTIAATFAVAMIVDHFGWLGIDRNPITLAKLAGIALIAAGTWLIVSD
jgi:bacterial/archaeal transporter family-2 protein